MCVCVCVCVDEGASADLYACVSLRWCLWTVSVGVYECMYVCISKRTSVDTCMCPFVCVNMWLCLWSNPQLPSPEPKHI